MGVYIDNREYKRWSEPPIYRILKARYNTSSGNLYPAQEDHTTDSTSSQVQSHYSYPVIAERPKSNVPKSQVSHLKSGFNSPSITQQQSNVVYHRSRNKVFPDDKKIQQANSDAVFSAGVVLVPPHIYRARAEAVGGFKPEQVAKRPVGFGPSNRRLPIYSHSSKVSPNVQDIKSESEKINVNPSTTNMHHQELHLMTRPQVGGHYSAVFPKTLNHGRANLQNVFRAINKKTDSIVKGHSPGSDSAGKAPTWSPRVHNSDVMSEAKGYTHVRRLKPGFDKTRPQASSTAGRKFLETGFPPVKQNQDSRSRLGPPPTAHSIPVQGKFKPFQRLPSYLIPADTHSSDSEKALSETFAGTTLSPSLNSTSRPSSNSVTGESASPMQAEGRDAELVPQKSNHEGQSESSAEDGSSLEQSTTIITSTDQPDAGQ
ncbi:uncharacterized protein LOC131982845 isoform X2 [Centropristis striata]|nr:uncharacterized protein LOC131982845 isoform X2 [Centropristis striata]